MLTPFEVLLKGNLKRAAISPGQIQQKNRSMLTPFFDLSINDMNLNIREVQQKIGAC